MLSARKDRPVKRLVGRLILVIAIILALTYVWNHYHAGSGGCSVADGADVAHADTAACPVYIVQAAGDPSWAAEQQNAIQDQRVTSGRYITNQVADPQAITSGWNTPPGISDRITDLLRISPNFPNFPSRGKPAVAGDVETKVAMVMKEAGATSGVVAINHPQMCDGVMGCKSAVAAILPQGSVLYVWELGASQSIEVTGEATS
jgi:hypothetical protein